MDGIALQAPLSMGFPRQQYWNGLLFPTPGDLPDPGTEPASLVSPALAGRSLPLSHPVSHLHLREGSVVPFLAVCHVKLSSALDTCIP